MSFLNTDDKITITDNNNTKNNKNKRKTECKYILQNTQYNSQHKIAQLTVMAIVATFVSSLLISSAHASTQWQPVASDTLIKLPAKIIHQKVQDDFTASPLAQRLQYIEQGLSNKANQIKSLQTLKLKASAHEQKSIAFDIVDLKSNYLGLLKESHDLRQQALNERQGLYEKILTKINKKFSKQKNVSNYQLKAAQQAAKERMKNANLTVGQSLNAYQNLNINVNAQSLNNTSAQHQYQANFERNLHKINQLKATLAQHSFNKKPEVDGIEVSDQAYIRSLLMTLATERSLLDQENTMLAYMTKLVALDAESLTVQIAQASRQSTIKQYTKANQVTDLFIEGE